MGGNRVSVLDPKGRLSVLAGTGEKGLSGDDGPALQARFNGPHHLLVGPDGRLYVADTFNNCVRRIDLGTGIVTRFAGTGEKGFGGDGGPAVKAAFDGVFNIAFHGGALYICDLGNRRVRAVDLKSGVVKTVAGSGAKGVPTDGGDALQEPLVDPRAIGLDAAGNLYIAERAGHALRVVDAAGRIRTVAGTGEAGDTGDGGPAREARLNGPKHLFVEASGDVLISDTEKPQDPPLLAEGRPHPARRRHGAHGKRRRGGPGRRVRAQPPARRAGAPADRRALRLGQREPPRAARRALRCSVCGVDTS